MSYIRTFRHDRRFKWSRIIAIDFSRIETVKKELNFTTVRFSSGQEVCFEGDDGLVFLEAFAEYAKDMQSLERGPVSFAAAVPPVFNTPQPTNTNVKAS